MPRISVIDLKPGMELAKPLSRGNMVILGEGTVLTETWISRIVDMDIHYAYIKGPSEQPYSKAEALEALEERFRSVIEKPHMEMLKTIMKDHLESLYA